MVGAVGLIALAFAFLAGLYGWSMFVAAAVIPLSFILFIMVVVEICCIRNKHHVVDVI
jgi:hypothetical protein